MTAEVRRMLERAAASADADAMLDAGSAALQQGCYAEAVAPLQSVLRSHPGSARLWHMLALLHRYVDDHPAAVDAFRKAEELAPGDAEIARGQAWTFFEAGLPAVDHFARAMRLAPADRSILLGYAGAQVTAGQIEAALGALEQQVLREPTWLEGHAALARIRWKQGGREDFTGSFERALVNSPRDLALWGAYIKTVLSAQLFERTLAVVKRGRAAAGPHVIFDAAEAVTRSELGDVEAAGVLFRRVAHLNDVTMLVHNVRYLLRTGRVKEATAIAEANAPFDPSNQIWPYVSIGWRLLGDKRWEWLEGHPKFIGIYDIAESLPPLDALAGRLRALHRTVHQPLDQSVRGGTQTEGHLFTRVDPEIRLLRKALVKVVEEHVAQLPPPQPHHPLRIHRRAPIRFSGSWSVRLTGGGRHVGHVHPAGWISSALYIALPGEVERGRGDAGWLSLGEVDDLGISLPPIRLVEPKPGRLVLFPSTMWHGTRRFDAGERLTVAFDVARPS